MRRKIVIATIDGGGPEYFAAAPLPNIARMRERGFAVTGRSVIPSVTNVNNVSIITGEPPSRHGVTSNYWYRPGTRDGVYMESPEFVLTENVLQRAKRRGMRTALLISKDKLKRMLEPGADVSFSAEFPPPELVAAIGPAQPIYSAEINHWLFRALRHVLHAYDTDLAYVSTTDYIMHKYPPGHEVAVRHLQGIDEALGQVLNDFPALELYLTADHGMNPKSQAVDLKRVLADEGLEAEFVPVIKDRYVVHHDNLGGIGYLYIAGPDVPEEERRRLTQRSIEVLSALPCVEAVYTREEAAAAFDLLGERIGDLVVLGTPEIVFGEVGARTRQVSIRSHGSRHESTVPIIGYNSTLDPQKIVNSRDIVSNLALD